MGDGGSRTVHVVRHLSTEGTPTGRIDRHELAAWLAAEDGQGICPDAKVSPALSDVVAGSVHLLVSPLARAQQTAAAVLAALDGTVVEPPAPVTMADLREAPLPVVRLHRVRMPLDAWDLVCRAAWLAGWSGEVESRVEVTARVRRAAVEVDRLSAEGPVTVVAHGFFNIMLARQLRSRGWIGPRLPARSNGAVTHFTRRHDPGTRPS
jgi:broad specificity phosphatase PhoE